MRKQELSRRAILRGGVAAAGVLVAPSIAWTGLLGERSPNGRIGLAMLGVGSRGSAVMGEFAKQKDAQFLAVCDPFRSRREAAKSYLEGQSGAGSVQAYCSYTDVMARDDIDAVVCCSCDHWHVPLAFAAARSRKDMYVEKPLGPSLAWSKLLRTEIQRQERVFQYGTQQRSGADFRRTVELVRAGAVGEVHRIDAWCVDGSRAVDWFDPKSTTPEPVPDDLDYPLWLGPAPLKPYSHYRVHREGSFHTYDYSIGFLGGWGSHPLDIAQWGLDSDHTSPVRYEGTGKVPTTGGLFSTVYEWDVMCTYESGVKLRFFSDRPAEPVVRKYRKRWSDHGTTFFGSEGWISVDRSGIETSDPRLLERKLADSDVRLPESRGHDRNFLDAVRSRGATLNPIESAIRSDTISHLSDITVRTGRAVTWDPKAERIVGDEEANARLTRPMRAPYGMESAST